MSLGSTNKNWQKLGQKDPFWAVLSWPEKKHNKWQAAELFETGENEVAALMEYLAKLEIGLVKGKALDFGCGVGRLTQALARRFDRAVGVDAAPAMLEQAGIYNKANNCSFVLNTDPALKIFSDNEFDFIYSRLTFQHIEPKYTKEYIKEFIRILKPGGVAVFSQPCKKSPTRGLRLNVSPKEILRTFLPVGVQNFFRNLSGKLFNKPIMELYSMEKADVMAVLGEKKAKLVNADVFGDLGSSWVCYRYCVQKL